VHIREPGRPTIIGGLNSDRAPWPRTLQCLFDGCRDRVADSRARVWRPVRLDSEEGRAKEAGMADPPALARHPSGRMGGAVG
jgi:hypothetical protein